MSVECTGKVWNWRSHRAGSCRPCGPGWCQRAWEQKAMLLLYLCTPKGFLTFHCSTAGRLCFPEQSQGNPTATTSPGLGPLISVGCRAGWVLGKCHHCQVQTCWVKCDCLRETFQTLLPFEAELGRPFLCSEKACLTLVFNQSRWPRSSFPFWLACLPIRPLSKHLREMIGKVCYTPSLDNGTIFWEGMMWLLLSFRSTGQTDLFKETRNFKSVFCLLVLGPHQVVLKGYCCMQENLVVSGIKVWPSTYKGWAKSWAISLAIYLLILM